MSRYNSIVFDLDDEDFKKKVKEIDISSAKEAVNSVKNQKDLVLLGKSKDESLESLRVLHKLILRVHHQYKGWIPSMHFIPESIDDAFKEIMVSSEIEKVAMDALTIYEEYRHESFFYGDFEYVVEHAKNEKIVATALCFIYKPSLDFIKKSLRSNRKELNSSKILWERISDRILHEKEERYALRVLKVFLNHYSSCPSDEYLYKILRRDKDDVVKSKVCRAILKHCPNNHTNADFLTRAISNQVSRKVSMEAFTYFEKCPSVGLNHFVHIINQCKEKDIVEKTKQLLKKKYNLLEITTDDLNCIQEYKSLEYGKVSHYSTWDDIMKS